MRSSGVFNTLDNIGHGTGAIGAEDLDGLDVSLLGNTVLLASNSAGAVSAVAVAILIGIALRNSLAPSRAALKVDVLSVCAGVNNVDINALTTIGGVQVLVERAEGKAVAVRDTSKTPWRVLLSLVLVGAESVDFLILLDKLDLGKNITSVIRSSHLLIEEGQC